VITKFAQVVVQITLSKTVLQPTEVEFGVTGKIEYLYNATGQKIQKNVADPSTTPVVTDYMNGGFQYTNNVLSFFPHAEGYVNVTLGKRGSLAFNYVYQYKDHLGNNRLNFSLDPLGFPSPSQPNPLKIIEENHYYPFGLKHTSYNTSQYEFVEVENGNDYYMNVSQLPAGGVSNYKYKFQGQERQDELGLNWDSYKWRNYDYSIGRFMSIDKLAEDYSYQSPYNFAENRVVDGREMEGLEWTSSTSSDGKTVNLNLNVRTVNNSGGIITNEQMATLSNERAAQLSSSLGGVDSQGRTVNVTVSYSNDASIIWAYSNPNDITKQVYSSRDTETRKFGDINAPGLVDVIGDSQNNRTQVNTAVTFRFDEEGRTVFNDPTTRKSIAIVGVHEDLHTVGERHSDDRLNTNREEQKKDKNNIMDAGYGENEKTNVTSAQRTRIINLIENQQ
jgi:RHS repeat-associated protein